MQETVYQIILCDDEQTQRDYLCALVTSWAQQAEIPIHLKAFESAEALLFDYAEHRDCDLLILDIEMQGMDGVSLARKIRMENEWVQIMFVTGYADYIADGYDVDALHYLMKPVNRQKFFEVLDRAVRKLHKNEQMLTLNLPGETVRVPLMEIRYLDVHQNYVTVHGKQEYTVKKTLRELEPLLDDRFFRIGRSCILNLSVIQRVTRTDVYLMDGSVVPLPRGMYEPLNRAIISRM
ncbi:MAG: LytR/AlgR family response regulator transcription factor [Candidatus Merdivicinus sp.]|jgi:DNA-binding LytR/AlgR family response regulator